MLTYTSQKGKPMKLLVMAVTVLGNLVARTGQGEENVFVVIEGWDFPDLETTKSFSMIRNYTHSQQIANAAREPDHLRASP